MADLLKKISDLTAGTPQENDVIPYVDLATNTTKKALKSELKGIQGDAATVDAGTTTTLDAGQSATVTNVGTTAAAIFNFAIPQGIQGLTGADGACVESVAFVGNDMVFTLDDTSTVTLTNAKTDLKGDTGLTGAKIVSASFIGDDLVFVLDDDSTVTVTGAKTTLKGDTGNPGETGATGKGITSITKTGTVGLVDTYTITYTDETTATFDVTNGEDGANGTNGTDGDDGISFIWKGAYVAETAYAPNDVVSYNGSTYICILASTGNLPTNATHWSLMAQKGVDGLGSGDMLASVYDPNSVVGDAFDMDNMAQGDTNLFVSSTEKSTWNGKQDALGFTPENVDNKVTSFQATPDDTAYPSEKLVKESLDGKIGSVVEDTAPQLGGQLDVNGQALGDGTLEILKFSETASAVNEITVKNAATGNAPEIQATGDDTNIDLNLVPKGTGIVKGETHTATFVLKDSATDLAIGTAIGGDFRIPGDRAITIKSVGAYVDTAAATGSDVLTVDINEAGTSILSTKITIDVGDKSSNDATTAPVISDSAIAADAILTFDIDQVNETTPAKGLKVWIEFTY